MKRETHRSNDPNKLRLRAVKDAKGRFKDIQEYSRAHERDLKRRKK